MKSKGQRLYEHRHPAHARVWTRRVFGEPMLVPNPRHIVPWDLLTDDCKASYEREAQGHWLFSRKEER